MSEFPKIASVEALSGKKLRITFLNRVIRIYDCAPLLNTEPFKFLQSESFFRNVKVDEHGYGLIWNDEVDLAESELWLNSIEQARVGE